MFFILSKLLYFIVSPLAWVVILGILVLFTKNPKNKKRRAIIAFALLLFFSNPFILNQVMHSWEPQAMKVSDVKAEYDIAVLLGGAMRYYNSETDRLVYGSSVDRVMVCAELYHEEKVKKILISGGSGSMVFQDMKEAPLLAKTFRDAGVANDDIIMESESRNTHENAIESAKILKDRYPGARVLLVTSAYHLPRSIACFEKQGIEVTGFPCDQHSGKQFFTPDRLLIPHAVNLVTWEKLLHEWLGFIVYKVTGYV
ncbi:MAG: YdcF family protein [Bacteroidia bacterium]|nr:YdcF family protein [Bacteroidia bacterium]